VHTHTNTKHYETIKIFVRLEEMTELTIPFFYGTGQFYTADFLDWH